MPPASSPSRDGECNCGAHSRTVARCSKSRNFLIKISTLDMPILARPLLLYSSKFNNQLFKGALPLEYVTQLSGAPLNTHGPIS